MTRLEESGRRFIKNRTLLGHCGTIYSKIDSE